MGNKQTLVLFPFKNVQIDEIFSSKEAAEVHKLTSHLTHNVSSFFCKCIWSLLFGIDLFFFCQFFHLFIFTPAKLK